MIRKEEFYREFADKPARQRMWAAIRREMHPSRAGMFLIGDRRSFLYGAVVALLLYFAGVGIVATIRETANNAKPRAVRLDEAYQSAIDEFERIVPAMANDGASAPTDRTYIDGRKQQLASITSAIASLKSGTQLGDLSPLKQQRLRQLYGMKLTVLQQLIDQGAFEL
jgi:hypothetical protein